jgi:beta-aspartyl-dipeptidase (metallo-type)
VFCVELIKGGITTVVGTLGTDNTMRTPVELLAKVKALGEEGFSAFMYSGGYTIPPATLMGSLRNDVMFIDEVVGAGEIAVSDTRAVTPTSRDFATVVIETRVGGMLARKAGVTHVHVGANPKGLQPVIDALDEFTLEPSSIYPTHITRSNATMRQAIALARRGSFVDIDTTEGDLAESLASFERLGGPFEQLTISTDAGGDSPTNLLQQLAAAADAGRPLARLLPLVTLNTARVLHLPTKGRLAPGHDADVLVLDPDRLEAIHVIARGKLLMTDREIVKQPQFLKNSDREIMLSGEKA